MIGPLARRAQTGHVERSALIEIVELVRRDDGVVRSDEGAEQGPGLIEPGGGFGEPGTAQLADLAVILRIGGFATSDVGREVAGAGVGLQAVAHQRGSEADPVDHVDGNDLLGKAVVVLPRTKMKLADGDRRPALFLQPVSPAGNRSVVGLGARPGAELMHPAPRLHARASRDADGSRRIGHIEHRAAGGQCVDMRRLDQRMAVAAARVAPVLVGADDEDIVSHRRSLTATPVRPRIPAHHRKAARPLPTRADESGPADRDFFRSRCRSQHSFVRSPASRRAAVASRTARGSISTRCRPATVPCDVNESG